MHYWYAIDTRTYPSYLYGAFRKLKKYKGSVVENIVLFVCTKRICYYDFNYIESALNLLNIFML